MKKREEQIQLEHNTNKGHRASTYDAKFARCEKEISFSSD